MKQKKIWVLQGRYEDGWEDLTTETTDRTEMILHEFFRSGNNIVVSALQDIILLCRDKEWDFDACVTAARKRLTEEFSLLTTKENRTGDE